MLRTQDEVARKILKRLEKIATIYDEVGDSIRNESQTRISLIDNFIRALGYNLAYPTEVAVEHWTDESYKEKADYMVYRNGQPFMIIEAKALNHELTTSDEEQLINYLETDESVIVGILTNGKEYRYFGRNEDKDVINSPFITMDMTKTMYSRETDILVSISKEGEYYEDVNKYFIKKDVGRKVSINLNQVLMYPNDDVLRAIARQMGLQNETLEELKDAYYNNVFDIDMYQQKKAYDMEEKLKEHELFSLRQTKRTVATTSGKKTIRKVLDMLSGDTESLVGYKPVELIVNETTFPINNWVSLQKVLLELMDDSPLLQFNVMLHEELETKMKNLSHNDIPHNKYEVIEYLPRMKVYARINNKTNDVKELCSFIAKYMGLDKLVVTLV